MQPAPEPPAVDRPDAGRRLVGLALGSALVGAPGLFGGCSFVAGEDHRGPDAPRALPLARPVRMAWVLSSGGPRGFVHVGVLKALGELGLQPDLIVGASVGALVGTLHAAGMAPDVIEQLALDLNPVAMARLAIGADERFSGAPLADLVRARLPSPPHLDRLPLAMAVAAARRDDGQVVAFTAGDAGVAVQASAAVEGQFAPVRIDGQAYVDADRHAPLPVRLARALGAQRVLAVDASAHEDRAPPGAERYRAGDLRKRALTAVDAREADLVLHPDFGYWVSLSRDFRERAIAAGHRDTLAQADALRRLHA
ncbi:patatin-like phospholipase family protein [Rubrivivax albus]|nr:patatin-like phospholipase family protein [Rubrivivax albus]